MAEFDPVAQALIKAITEQPGKRDDVVRRAWRQNRAYRKTEFDLRLSQLHWAGDVKYRTDTQEFYRE